MHSDQLCSAGIELLVLQASNTKPARLTAEEQIRAVAAMPPAAATAATATVVAAAAIDTATTAATATATAATATTAAATATATAATATAANAVSVQDIFRCATSSLQCRC